MVHSECTLYSVHQSRILSPSFGPIPNSSNRFHDFELRTRNAYDGKVPRSIPRNIRINLVTLQMLKPKKIIYEMRCPSGNKAHAYKIFYVFDVSTVHIHRAKRILLLLLQHSQQSVQYQTKEKKKKKNLMPFIRRTKFCGGCNEYIKSFVNITLPSLECLDEAYC